MNSRIWYPTGNSRSRLPDPSTSHYQREIVSASTSPSGRMYVDRGRRNSKPDRFLHAEPIPRHSSRSQEDVRSSATYHNLLAQRRPSPNNDRVHGRLLAYQQKEEQSRFADDDDDDDERNASTDDDLDVPETRQRPRAPSDSRPKSASHYAGSSPTDHDRLGQNNSRSRTNINDPETKERQRRAEHRRASLHLDVIRNCNDYSSNMETVSVGNGNSTTRINVHSPSPHHGGNPTIQLHFGGQKVKDYNQYSPQLAALSSPARPLLTQQQQSYSTYRLNDAERPFPGAQSQLRHHPSHPTAASSASKDIPLNSAFHRLNCHGPSSQQHTSYY